MTNDSSLKTFVVASLLCLVCSVLVSTAAVQLKSRQVRNQRLDRQKNILLAGGLLASGPVDEQQVARLFGQVESQLIDLETGELAVHPDPQLLKLYDQEKAAKDPVHSQAIAREQDLAKLKRRAKWGWVYLVRDDRGDIDVIIVPIKGKGLWSTIYGFLALERDGRVVRGIGIYRHGETPGLGGEIDNPAWQTGWKGKQVSNERGEPVLQVLKGAVAAGSALANRQIDGLSGATITSRGMENMVRYWVGSDGYGKFLSRLGARHSLPWEELPEGDASIEQTGEGG